MPHTDLQGDFFESWVPDWIPGETLYGLCGRYHRIAGHRLASMTCQRLFGHPRAGLNHDLPGRVDEFVLRTHGQLGSADDILLERTVLAYYLRFRSSSDALSVQKRLRESGPGPMKAELGLLATRMGAAHPLRACWSCVDELKREHGIATWMLSHQLPGVWFCDKHHEPLLVAQVKVNGLQRFQWLLPDDVALCLPAALGAKAFSDPIAMQRMRLIAEASAELLAKSRGFSFDASRLASTCLFRLVDLHLASPNGRLRAQLIGREFSAFLGVLSGLPEHDALCLSPNASLDSLRRLLLPGVRLQHPLRCILATIWLFGSWKEFMKAYEAGAESHCPVINMRPASTSLTTAVSDCAEHDEKSFLQLVRHHGFSIRSAAQRTGVSINTGLIWATRAGVEVLRRPKTLIPSTRKRVITALRDGASKQAAANLGGISVVSVTRILASDECLRIAWREVRESRQRINARSLLLGAMENTPNAGIKEIRGLVPAAYAWLYRHDKPWLDAKTSTLPRKVGGNNASLDWAARDMSFVRDIATTLRALDIASTDVPGPMQIVRLVPGLRSKLRHLDRLPLTRAALGSR